MASTPWTASLLSNSSSVQQVFSGIIGKFDKLYARRAFVHWFVGEGLEEKEMSEARWCIDAIRRDYCEAESHGADEAEQPPAE